MPIKTRMSRADKLSKRKWKTEDNITVAGNDSNIVYLCDKCNISLNPMPNDDGVYICLRCKKTYLPDQEPVKRDLPFSNPDEDQQQQQSTPAVTSIGYEGYYGNLKPKQPELKGGFLALSQKGLKIKDYRED